MQDIKEIQEQFNKVLKYSQGFYCDMKTDELFEKWKENKKKYIDAWGGLIYEHPDKVSFELDSKSKREKVQEFVNMIETTLNNYALSDFVNCNIDGFFGNILLNDYCLKDGTIIKKGTKFVRAFKYFIPNDEQLLESVQNYASRIIQENKIEGTLCLSVHPLDFLSTSENCHNWRSCHALDGEYRVGNLSYMTDSSTIICYLRADGGDTYVLPDFSPSVKWNSKKWRVLLFFSDYDDMIFAGRQYPFTTESGINLVRDVVLPNANLGYWNRWWKKKITNLVEDDNYLNLEDKFIPINGTLKGMHQLVKDGSSLHFNDLLRSSCYEPLYAFSNGRYIHRDTAFHIGGPVKCVCCGKNDLEVSEYMNCYDCGGEYVYHCVECGTRMSEDDAYWCGDDTLCYHCFTEYCVICEDCSESIYKDDAYEDDNGMMFCRWCYDRRN